MRTSEALYTGPYTSKGKHISKSHQHEGMWLVTLVGTNMGYAITMSTQAMLQNNPPDPAPAIKKKSHGKAKK